MKLLTLSLIFLTTSLDARSEEKLHRFEFSEKKMGTLFRFVLYAPSEEIAQQAAKEGFQRVQLLNDTMSDYDPASELMRLCKHFSREIGTPVKVSPELFFVLKQAQALSEQSNGAFDVTIGPVVKLWRQSRRTQELPEKEELKAALEKVGYQKMELNERERTVKLLVPGMQLDLGGIAKGYAADEVMAIFAKHQIKSALVAAGGDITVGDPPPDAKDWTVEIAPLPGSKEKRVLKLKNASVSTSGDAENFVLIDGVRYSHIVDPKTGIGLTGYRSVTVIARKGITADCTTKAAMILPADDALKLIESIPGTATLILQKIGDGETMVQSKNFASFLKR